MFIFVRELIRETPRLPLKNIDHVPVLIKPGPELVEEVAKCLAEKLHITNRTLLNECSVMTVPSDFLIFEPGHNDNKSVVFVYEGELEVGFKTQVANEIESDIMFYINAGEIFGSLVYLTG